MSEQPNSDNSRQDALRTARRQITRSLLLSLAALGVIVIACYAWFVRNTTVSGALGSISAEGSTFELASVGGAGAFDQFIPAEYKVTGEPWQNDTGTITTNGMEAILWSLSDESNLGNQLRGTGIQPGSYGTLKFYIVPKVTGELKLTFQLELVPGIKAGASPDTIHDLLRGHLLFAWECAQANESGSNNTPAWIDCTTHQFPLTFSAVKDTPIPVQLHWKWPYILSDVTGDQTILSWMKDYPHCFFYQKDTTITIENTNALINNREYSSYFNNADQYIGENVNNLRLQMIASEG